MFEAFQKNGMPWERSQQAKTNGRIVWLYKCLDVSGSDKSRGKVSVSLNHPIKLVTTQTYMWRVHVICFLKEWHALGMKPTGKNPWLDCMVTLLSGHVLEWKTMLQSKCIIEPPNKTCYHTNIYV